jgi:hypothetical protein
MNAQARHRHQDRVFELRRAATRAAAPPCPAGNGVATVLPSWKPWQVSQLAPALAAAGNRLFGGAPWHSRQLATPGISTSVDALDFSTPVWQAMQAA